MKLTDELTVDDPVRRLADRIARRVADAGGAHASLDPDHVRELAHAVAWNVIEETGSADAAPSEWLPRVCRALAACGAAETATLLMLFDTQLVRPAAWTFHGGQPFWILDCERLVPGVAERTALLLDRGLTAILGRMAPLWDPSAGEGVLGLRRAARLAAVADTGGRSRRRSRQPMVNALRRQCADRLALLARRRAWRRTPEVVLMDTDA